MTCLRMLALLPADRIVPPMSPAPETAARHSNDPAPAELTPPAPIASTPAVESQMPEPAVAAPVAVEAVAAGPAVTGETLRDTPTADAADEIEGPAARSEEHTLNSSH